MNAMIDIGFPFLLVYDMKSQTAAIPHRVARSMDNAVELYFSSLMVYGMCVRLMIIQTIIRLPQMMLFIVCFFSNLGFSG